MAMLPLGSDEADRSPIAEINVTPLVDVMLVLLVIFMVTAPMLTASVAVDLPRAGATAPRPPAPPLNLTLRADGTLFLDREALPGAELPARLAALRAADPDRTVHLRADRALDYGAVMQVMGQVQRAGITRVALVALPAEAP